jgi:DNA polymerase V
VSGIQSLFDEIGDSCLLIRRLQITAEQVLPLSQAPEEPCSVQLEMFVDYEAMEHRRQEERLAAEREKRLQTAILSMKEKYGKNILLRGSSYQKGATARERNGQIGGHRA